MKIESVVRLINSMVKDEKYHKARTLIIKEWDRITESRNYFLLNTNAQQLIKVIRDEKENGFHDNLSDSDKKLLNLINRYVSELQLHFARRIFMENNNLLEKPEAQSWLTSDAKYIYQAWKQSV